jgi:hypothetical protein
LLTNEKSDIINTYLYEQRTSVRKNNDSNSVYCRIACGISD